MGNHYKAIKVNGKKIDEHRYIMEVHLGRKLATNEVVHHKDDNKFNNEISNLELMSRSEHSRMHMIGHKLKLETIEKLRVHGKKAKGSPKLTDEEVIIIKQLVANGASQTKVAKQFNIHRTCIGRIITGKGYKWV